MHVAAQPDILLHVEYRLEVAVPAEGGGTPRTGGPWTPRRSRDPRAHRGHRPVDLHVSPGLVSHSADNAAPDGELAVALVESVVGHRGLVAAAAALAFSECRSLSLTSFFASSRCTRSQSGSGWMGTARVLFGNSLP